MDQDLRGHGIQQSRRAHVAPHHEPGDTAHAQAEASMKALIESEQDYSHSHSHLSNATATRKLSGSSGLLSKIFARSAEHSDSGKPEQNTTATDVLVPKIRTDVSEEEGAHRLSVDRQDPAKVSPIKQRKRKGSLRKIALLGGRKVSGDSREEKDALPTTRMRQSAKMLHTGSMIESIHIASSQDESTVALTVHEDTPAVATARLHLLEDSIEETHQTDTIVGRLSSPSDPKSANGYASTTEDDDEGLSFSRQSTSEVSIISSEATYPPPLPVPSPAAYFPSDARAVRPRSQHRVRPSPLQFALAPAPEAYSYAETEYWGWVLLFVTWMSFTVGMGSCLDIWSWAWDVGKTPYAPPELEDDPTLPIVGYYPALIVLTGVVAWVWITVAWIGMKYFRHAKIEV